MADLLEIGGENPFRVRAYRNAARTVRDLGRDVSVMVSKGENLAGLPGIGEDLAGKIAEIVRTGGLAALRKVRRKVPPGLSELLRIPSVGPKRAKLLHERLRIRNARELAKACRAGKIRTVPGFGEKTETRILDFFAQRESSPRRFSLATASRYAEGLVEVLKQVRGVQQVEVAGSLRRGCETVGDIDILATALHSAPVMKRFESYEGVGRVLGRGPTRSTVVLRNGIQVDLRVVEPKSFGAAAVYLTGSKAHGIALRQRAVERGLKINEYGVFREEARVAGETEESVYRAIGLAWIPPELRENRGEIEAAETGRLPHLVELSDLRGDLHAHTRATDGRNSLAEMAEAARLRGYEYLAITEHSRRLAMAKGLDERRLLAQVEEIARVNEKLRGITLLAGIEVDILENGRLDLADSALSRLDLVVGSVHSHFRLSRAKQTERILRAMDNRYFTIFAHPTGRLLGEREPYEVDMAKIIGRAAGRGCFLEVNAHPERLDLLDTQCRMAKDAGVRLAIDSDAHSVVEFDNLRFGVGQARRGWIEKGDVINTRALRDLRQLLRKARG